MMTSPLLNAYALWGERYIDLSPGVGPKFLPCMILGVF